MTPSTSCSLWLFTDFELDLLCSESMAPMSNLVILFILWSDGIQIPHFAKCPSDLKHNGTQEKTQLSSTVFNALSPGVIGFVASNSSKNHLLDG